MIRNKKNCEIVIDLTGPDGNAYVLLGMVQNLCDLLRDNCGIVLDPKSIRQEMMSGDYENLILVFDSYFGTIVTLER